MKTKLQIISIALTGFIFASCSSSMYMSKTSSTPSDDIYYTPSKTTSTLATSENNTPNHELSKLNLAQLEKKYSKVLASDTGNIDTLVYKVEDSNPYDSILSNSYQDSYERRLKGMYDSHNRMDDYGVYYSNNYWYASTFDPAFYNAVMIGGQMWVEPWYISSMFLWPHNHFSVGFGIGWNPWYSNYYSPYYGYNNWYGWDPYYWNSNYYTNNFNNNNNYYYYGRRTGGSTTITTPRFRSGNSYERQIISSRGRNGLTFETTARRDDRNTSTIRTRNTTQSTDIAGSGQRNPNQEVTSRKNRTEYALTRLRNEGTLRNTERTELTRRNNQSGNQINSNFQRPRSTNNDDYIRSSTRNQNINDRTNNLNSRNTTTTREGRNTTPTYNSPNRVGTSTSRERPTSSGNSGTVTPTTRERSSSSGSPARESTYSRPSSSSSSSSGSSSSPSPSSSSSTSNSSRGGDNNTRRR